MVVLNPYLNFTDKAEEVLNFYQSVLGGEVEMSRFGDMADSLPSPLAEEHKNLLMHGVLKNDYLQIMVADSAPMGPSEVGGNIHLSLSGDDEAALTKYYEGLSAGGQIAEPLAKAPWGDTFGMFVDKFGIKWMVNIAGPKS